ncbi:hypothetical protein WN943_016613 [Citrus x changshan-huyou]
MSEEEMKAPELKIRIGESEERIILKGRENEGVGECARTGKTGEGFYFSVNTKGAFRATAPFILLCNIDDTLVTLMYWLTRGVGLVRLPEVISGLLRIQNWRPVDNSQKADSGIEAIIRARVMKKWGNK